VCSSRFRQKLDQRHPQNNVSPSCNNDGRCTTLNVTEPTSSKRPSLPERHILTSERKPHHIVDANGNSLMVTVQTAYGFNITRITERPISTPRWKNSNRSNRQQTINHEHLQEQFVICSTT
jgi:hypothetical protein